MATITNGGVSGTGSIVPGGAVPASTYSGPVDASINNTQQGANLVNANQAQAAKMGVTIPGSTQNPDTTKTTPTVLSNYNVVNQKIPEMNSKLATLSTTGATTGGDGLVRYSDNSFARAPEGATQNEDNTWGKDGLSYGVGPAGGDNPEVKKWNDTIDSMKGQFDAMMNAQINGIDLQFQQLQKKQEDVNMRAEASTNQSLLMGGSSRYAQISSTGITQAQASYGLDQIASLQAKKQQAIAAAQQAQQDGDFKFMEKSMNLAQDTYKEQQAAAQKLSDALVKANDDIRTQQKQDAQNLAITNLISQGITDPTQISKSMLEAGYSITPKEIGDSLNNLNPNAKAVTDIMTSAAKNGASPDILSAIGKSTSVAQALSAAGGAIVDPTSPLGQYQSYIKQASAAGQTPLSYGGFLDKQKYSDAYASAAGSAAGKASVDRTTNGGGADYSMLPSSAQATLQTNGFTKYNDSTQSLATQLVNGQLAPAELSKRTTGTSSYNDVLTAASKYSMAVNGKPFNISQADRDYKFATNKGTQDTLNYLGSLVGTDDGSGNMTGGNLNELISLSDGRIAPKSNIGIPGQVLFGMAGQAVAGSQGFPALNDAKQWAKLQTGDPEIAAYYATLLEVSDQIAKVLQGGGSSGTSDAKLRQAEELFQKGFTPDQVKSVAESLQGLLSTRASSMVKDNPYLSDYADQFGVKSENGVTTTNQKIMQDETVAEGKISAFYNASSENKALIDDVHKQFPDLSAQEIAQKLSL